MQVTFTLQNFFFFTYYGIVFQVLQFSVVFYQRGLRFESKYGHNDDGDCGGNCPFVQLSTINDQAQHA